MSPHPIKRYRSDKVVAQRWIAQPNDIANPASTAMTLGGSWCITLADETICGEPMRPSDGAHIVADFVDEHVARWIVDLHNDERKHPHGG